VELLDDAGLPPGGLNLVHGGKQAVDALLRHPLVTADHCRRVAGYIEKGVEEGAEPLVDGREIKKAGGFFPGPTIFDHVTPEMTILQ
jgi:acyl-CoA reductase-like NAD-dependent aldehyde dehydrogenase